MVVKVRAIYQAVFENRVVRFFLRAVPSLAETLMLGKILHEARSEERGQPALGPGGGRRPRHRPRRAAAAGAPGAPRHRPGRAAPARRGVDAGAPARTRPRTAVVLVSLPEEMPVTETIELDAQLGEGLQLPRGPVFLNAMPDARFTPRNWTRLRGLSAVRPPARAGGPGGAAPGRAAGAGRGAGGPAARAARARPSSRCRCSPPTAGAGAPWSASPTPWTGRSDGRAPPVPRGQAHRRGGGERRRGQDLGGGRHRPLPGHGGRARAGLHHRPGPPAGHRARARRRSATPRPAFPPRPSPRPAWRRRGELFAMMLDVKRTWDDLVTRHAPDAGHAATGSWATASTSRCPGPWPARRSTWPWRSSTSSPPSGTTT